MTNYTSKHFTLQSISDTIKEQSRTMLEEQINTLLATELSVDLDYEKYERTGWEVDNSRNGYYKKKILTDMGMIEVKVPRDRKSEFKTQLFNKYQTRADSLENMIIGLYSKGITTREISDLIAKMYGHHYSPATISNITDAMIEKVNEYHNRVITTRYDVIYIDATHISIKRDGYYSKEAVHIALGVTKDGYKEIIDYAINPTESASFWDETFKDLINRGLKKPKLFVTDALSGIFEVIENNFDKPKIQTCLVHVCRNVMKSVKLAQRSEVANDLSKIRQCNSKQEAQHVLELFCEKWGSNSKYLKMCKQLLNNKYLLTLYDVPEQIQKSIYSTNVIESLMKKLKTGIKKKGSFPTSDSLDKYLYLNIEEYNDKNYNRSHRGFKDLEWD